MTITAGSTGTVFRSRWPDVVIPPMSLPQFLLAAADRGDRPALVDGLTGRVTSYGRFAALVDRAAAGLAANGLRPGPRPRHPRAELARVAGRVLRRDGRGRRGHRAEPDVHPGRGGRPDRDSGARFLLTDTAFLPTARAATSRRAARSTRPARRARTPAPLASATC